MKRTPVDHLWKEQKVCQRLIAERETPQGEAQ